MKNTEQFYSEIGRQYNYEGHTLILPNITDNQKKTVYDFIVSSKEEDWHISWRGTKLYYKGRCIIGDNRSENIYFNEDTKLISAFKDSIIENIEEIYQKRAEKYKKIINDEFIVEGNSSPSYFKDNKYKYLIDFNFQKSKYKIGIWNFQDNFTKNPLMILDGGEQLWDGQLGNYTIYFHKKNYTNFFNQSNYTFVIYGNSCGTGVKIGSCHYINIWSEDVKENIVITNTYNSFPEPTGDSYRNDIIKVID